MNISRADWVKFINRLSKINKASADAMLKYLNENGIDDIESLISYGFDISQLYGNASAAQAAAMYDALAELEGARVPPAALANNPEYSDVAKAINGTLKISKNYNMLSGSVSRLVKQVGQDTLLNNALRDGAQWAWIPNGDTCAFCITLASRGWQYASKKALKNGHAEHIHANCDCSYCIRFSQNVDVTGYNNGERYLKMYRDAEGGTPDARINAMRRQFYKENATKIRAQKADAYEKRKELNSSAAEETEA